jgi:hypothetical protein
MEMECFEEQGEAVALRPQSDDGSRIARDRQVRLSEKLGMRFLLITRPIIKGKRYYS